MPREFVLAPGGRFVLVANQGDNSVEVFSRNSESGRLGDKLQSIDVDAPAFLALVPMEQE
ncbi:Lactonase, 7-bladed beta-propeller [compost metagenome]